MNETNELNDTLFEKANLHFMLEFETQIFLDMVRNDGLIIAAKGLNLDLILLNILKVYQDPGNLVLVLNASDGEEKYFKEKLNNEHVYIEHDSGNDRIEEYLCGGIHFLAARILVVDLLKKRIPIEKITGIILLRAHRIFESCNEAFALKLYRLNNKTGFIKAFSNSAQSFSKGFCHVERVMRALFVKELFIWPRFHTLVRNSLKNHEPQVIELDIPITGQMKKLQSYILEIMNLTIKELKRMNPSLELEEVTVENCLTRKFHKILQMEMNEIWHQLSSRSTRLLAELKTLRHLILLIFYTDSVTFFATLSEYRKFDYAKNADWVLNKSADLLFRDSSSLIYAGDKEFNPEFPPKWDALLDLLKVEIPSEIQKKNLKDATVLILCSDHRTCYQLNELLTTGPYRYLFSVALKKKISFKSLSQRFKTNGNLQDVANQVEIPKPVNKKKVKKISKENEEKEKNKKQHNNELEEEEEEANIEEIYQSTYILTMSQEVLEENNLNSSIFTPYYSPIENMTISQICESIINTPKILIQTFKGAENYISLQNNLEIIKPNFVILYNSNITAVREIEMYEAHRQNNVPLKIYYLIYGGTVEEQGYLTSLRREKEAFEFLIETKASMVIPEDQDGKSENCLTLQRGEKPDEFEKNTRQGGQQEEIAKKRIIIVDMREFRSDLPGLIHKRGIEIEPVTITVGDYIITPEICVERKSISDLISSLNSGRLYQQCTQMQRFYAKPMLLIEFDQNRPFNFRNQFMISEDENTNSFGVQEKLLLLTIHFPQLRIIWSPSPYATAQLFEELKQGKDEPNVENALAIGGDQNSNREIHYNSNIYDFVQKLPGINSKTIDIFLRKGINMQNILNMSELELKEILGNSKDAETLYKTLHNKSVPQEENKQKFKFGKYKSAGSLRGGGKLMKF